MDLRHALTFSHNTVQQDIVCESDAIQNRGLYGLLSQRRRLGPELGRSAHDILQHGDRAVREAGGSSLAHRTALSIIGTPTIVKGCASRIFVATAHQWAGAPRSAMFHPNALGRHRYCVLQSFYRGYGL